MFVEGWAPEYGAPFDPDEQMAPAEGTIDPTVELTDWEPLEGVDDGIDQVAFVDGVRRIDARLLLDDPAAGPTPGICGTFAVGATRWHRRERWSEITDVRVERWAVLAGGLADELPAVELDPPYRTATTPSDDPSHLIGELHTRMRRAEGELASALAADAFVVADGPLNKPLAPLAVVGYIKSHRVTYLPPEQNVVIAELAPGTADAAVHDRGRPARRLPVLLVRAPRDAARRPLVDRDRPLRGLRQAARRTTCGRSPIARRRCCRSSAPSRTSIRGRRRTWCRSPRSSANCATGWAIPAWSTGRCGTPSANGRRHDRRRRRPGPRLRALVDSEFRVVLDDDEYLQLDDLVVVRTQVPKAGEVATYGVVTEAESVYEGATYESDTHRIAELGIMPAAKVRSARVAVTRVDPEIWVSPDPGEIVQRATGDERAKALYLDEMGRPLPIGIGRDGEPVAVDLDFFDGRKGGHMSISGISGVATKTSFALFFLRMLTGHPGVVGEGASNLRVLVFNVKGEDLLWLDKPNRFFDDEAAAGWAKLGVEPGPFPSVRFWAPAAHALRRRRRPRHRRPPGGRRRVRLDAARVHRRGLLQFLFTDANDARNQIPFVRERVQSQLKRFAVDVVGMPGAVVLRDPATRRTATGAASRSRRRPASGSSPTCSRSSTRSGSSWSRRTAPSPTGRGAAG